jgi:hypothetical protein
MASSYNILTRTRVRTHWPSVKIADQAISWPEFEWLDTSIDDAWGAVRCLGSDAVWMPGSISGLRSGDGHDVRVDHYGT